MADKLLDQIREKLGHCSMKYAPALFLQTGIPDLNRVLGHAEKGLCYGTIIELSGMESMGKTAIALSLAALAQRDKAVVIWGDLEHSFDPGWARIRGLAKCPTCKDKVNENCPGCGGKDSIRYRLDPDNLIVIQPYIGTFAERNERGKMVSGKTPRLSTIQELAAEVEATVTAIHKKHDRMVVVMDSLAAMLTQIEASAGLEGANLVTAQSLPKFLGQMLRRWMGLTQSCNALVILINQLRQNPMARFGSPWYCPGGNAPRFYSHVRVRAKRVTGSRIVEGNQLVGIQGLLECRKNKIGGVEGSTCGYKLMLQGPLQFIPAKTKTKGESDEDE